MTAELRHTAVGAGARVTSALSGRRIAVNPHLTRFLVPPTYASQAMVTAVGAWTEAMGTLHKAVLLYQCAALRRWVERELPAETTAESFAATVDRIADALRRAVCDGSDAADARKWETYRAEAFTPTQLVLGRGDQARVLELLMALHRHGCLLAPAAELRAQLFTPERVGWERVQEYANAFLGDATLAVNEVVARAGGNERAVRARLLKLVMATQGVREVGDLTTSTLRPLAPVFARESPDLDRTLGEIGASTFSMADQDLKRLLLALQKAQSARYGSDPSRQVPQDYHELRGSSGKRSRGRRAADADANNRLEFPYLARRHSSHVAWVDALRGHVRNLANRIDVQATVAPLDTLMRDLFKLPDVPVTPLEFCALGPAAADMLRGVIFTPARGDTRRATYVSEADAFFAYVLNTDGLLPDGSRDPRYRNPVQFIARPRVRRRGQTKRRAMAPWLVRAARELIVADDFAWPRSREVDYFDVPVPGGARRVWSPVLAELALLRFMIPIRVKQARLLGSGEGDTWVWREGAGAADAGAWAMNEGPWRPPPGEDRAHGLLRRVWDPTKSAWATGLYISTNKTADRENGFDDQGYEIAWSSREIVALFERVRRFQAEHNPPRAPKSRVELLSERTVSSDDVTPRLPRMHYLFRDRCDPDYPDEPVTPGRVRMFWVDLMAELERRFAADPHGPREDDGSPLRLVRAGGQSAEYDLHSVRVTGITALALNGCPIQVVMMLAGHASWLMTMHYVKPSPSDLRGAMDRATERIEAAEGDSWESAIAELGADALNAMRFATSAAGMEQLQAERGAFVLQMDHGLCPNGGTMCGEGGPEVQKGVHGPVPGGATNCQSCRFLVSGPQFLGGLIARLNTLSADVLEAGAALRGAEGRRREAVTAHRREQVPSAKLAANVRRAEAAVAAADERARQVSESWQNLMELIRRCERVLREYMARRGAAEPGSGRSLVVLNGTVDDFRLQFERCTDYDLVQRICEDAEVYAVDARHAARLRGARLDRVLAQSGRPAVFAGLTEEESIEVGNLFGRWLRTRLGATTAAEVVEGRRTLAEAGVLDEAEELLASGSRGVELPAGLLVSPAQLRLAPGASE